MRATVVATPNRPNRRALLKALRETKLIDHQFTRWRAEHDGDFRHTAQRAQDALLDLQHDISHLAEQLR